MTICFNDARDLAKFVKTCIMDSNRYYAQSVFGTTADYIIKSAWKTVEITNSDISVEETENLLKERKVKYNWVNLY